jgi:hypothetical protein
VRATFALRGLAAMPFRQSLMSLRTPLRCIARRLVAPKTSSIASRCLPHSCLVDAASPFHSGLARYSAISAAMNPGAGRGRQTAAYASAIAAAAARSIASSSALLAAAAVQKVLAPAPRPSRQ